MMEGEPEVLELAEKVGKGEAAFDREGCSSRWDDKVRVSEGFCGGQSRFKNDLCIM